MKTLKIGILGAGTAGGGLIRLIQERLSQEHLPLEIKRVGVRDLAKPRSLALHEGILTSDLTGIAEDPEIDILVEAMGGLEPARTCIAKAFEAGKHVVTSNKHVVSEWGEHLHELARRQGRHFLYEASVAGSIPIVEILREEVIPDRIRSLYGILNGTTNFILTRMTEAGESYRAALAKAQELGFSEPDPSFDISGKDASQKLSILISLLKGEHCHPAQIDVRGIESITPWDIQFAMAHHWVIKPLATYEEVNGMHFASVEPVFLARNSVLASARNEYNALCFGCESIGNQILIGKGAGEKPTASALLSDLKKILEDPHPTAETVWPKSGKGATTRFRSCIENPNAYRFYINSSHQRNPEQRKRIYEILCTDCELIQEHDAGGGRPFALAVVTQKIPFAELFRLLDLILSLDPESEVSWIRILEDL
ncbi:MAG: homoserine dehydrogenase [Terriglobia bacterium]